MIKYNFLIFACGCLGMLEETSKVSQLEDDRFNRMQHFYGADEIDSSTSDYLDLGDDGKVRRRERRCSHK